MKSRAKKTGFTMAEMMIAVAVLLILVGMVIGFGSRLKTQSQEALTKNTLTLLGTALEQYYDYTGKYPPDVNYTGASETRDFSKAFDPAYTATVSTPPAGFAYLKQPAYDYSSESIEVLYYYLNRVPQSRQILGKVSETVVSGKAVPIDSSNKPVWREKKLTDPNLVLTINGQDISLLRVVDAWQVPLQYTHVRPTTSLNIESSNFPLVRSAGPDKKFNTADDVTSRKEN